RHVERMVIGKGDHAGCELDALRSLGRRRSSDVACTDLLVGDGGRPPNVIIPRRGSAMTSSFRFPRSVCYAALLMTVTGDLGTRDRLDAAFAREERRGRLVAGAAPSGAILLLLGLPAGARPGRRGAAAWV